MLKQINKFFDKVLAPTDYEGSWQQKVDEWLREPLIDMDQRKPDGTKRFPLDKDWDSNNPTVQRWITGKPNPNARKRTPGEPPVW